MSWGATGFDKDGSGSILLPVQHERSLQYSSQDYATPAFNHSSKAPLLLLLPSSFHYDQNHEQS
ncbi:hypothetical protein [Nostoc sp.]|uniref:hypothetical protein n=1 Tax=Nostoc sp. TaxID=1180 RepID=UPI002FF5AA7D